MKQVKYLNENEVLEKGITALLSELGPVETARFLNISRDKRIESVKRHREWQKNLNVDDFFNEVF
jgi:transposase-like protein